MARGDGAEVGHRLAGVGLVDHRRQHHQAVDAQPLGVGGEPAGERGGALGHAVSTGTRPADMLDRRLQDLELLAVLQRAVLADGAQHDQPVDPGLDHGVEVSQRRRQVERLVGMKLGRRRGEDTLPVDGHEFRSSYSVSHARARPTVLRTA